MRNPHVIGNIHSIETFGALDGPGIRYILFLQGCALRCKYCHNPDTWAMGSGRQMTAEQAIHDMLRYKHFIKSGGITLSGGEPLLQSEFCSAVIDECISLGIHTAIDTSGAVPLIACREAVHKADLLLLDIKSLNDKMCIDLTGRSNHCALEMLDFRENLQKDVWIRHVIVPGYTLNYDSLERTAKYLSDYKCIKRVDLLPFHKMGEFKWEGLNEKYELYDVQPPTNEQMQRVKEIFLKYQLPVMQ